MGFKTPEEELQEFLAARPSWARKVLQADYLSLTAEENDAFLHGDWEQDLWPYSAEYERLCQRIPASWREYCKRKEHALVSMFVDAPVPGRPRKDARAEEATLLFESGESYEQIATFLNGKYGPETTTREAVRKLISSRKPRSEPGKT